MNNVYVLTYFKESVVDSTKVSESKEALLKQVQSQCENWDYNEDEIKEIISDLETKGSHDDEENYDTWTLVGAEIIED